MMNQLITCTLLTWALAGYLPSRPRPPITDRPGRVGDGGERNSSRHITATLQTQRVDLATNVSDAHLSNSSRSMGGWQREGLAGFGAGTVRDRDTEAKDIAYSRYGIVHNARGPGLYSGSGRGRMSEVWVLQHYRVIDFTNVERVLLCAIWNGCTSDRTVGGLSFLQAYGRRATLTYTAVELPLPHSRVGVNLWSTYLWAGIIGVSYGMRWNTAYPTLLDLLVQLGYIEVPVFSLAVGTLGEGSLNQPGSIVFGGVNRWKYRGYLEPIEIWPNPSDQLEQFQQVGYWINLTSFGYSQPGQSEVMLTGDGFARSMLIDTGSTFTYLDADLVSAVAKSFNAWIDEAGVYYVNCALRYEAGYVHFGFNQGNMVIQVSYADFIVDFDTYCALGVQPADLGVATWVLGNSFIRSAYSKFDRGCEQSNDV
ncbi:hypothetical protein CHU98_g12425 [Xylaria longipes]|nr:hypothetical protein CHU98_g12425 [Xylaria longipes]